jgi:hypothetical protein
VDEQDAARAYLASGMIPSVIKVVYDGKDAARAGEELATWMKKHRVKAVDVVGPDGAALGTITYTPAGADAHVCDEDAFTGYVEKTHPEHIARTVRSEYRALLLAIAKETGTAVDPETGQEVPGITVGVGTPTLRRTYDRAARQQLAQLIKTGRLPQLAAAPEPEAIDET